MSNGIISTLGLYNWDKSLFDFFHLPESINKDAFTFELLAETAELEVLYTDPDFLKQAINYWSIKRLPEWVRIESVLNAEYEPLENLDISENYGKNWNEKRNSEDTGSNTKITTTTGEDSNTSTTTGTRNTSENSTGEASTSQEYEETKTHEVTGFNSGTFENADRDKTSGSSSGESNDERQTTGTETANTTTKNNGTAKANQNETTTNANNGSTSGAGDETTTARRHGLTGTTYQDLIRKETQLRKLNLSNIIIDEYKHRFCLLIY